MKKIIFAIACIMLCACAENGVSPESSSQPVIQQPYDNEGNALLLCGTTLETAEFVEICTRDKKIYPVNGACPLTTRMMTSRAGEVVCEPECPVGNYWNKGNTPYVDVYGNCRSL